MNCHVRRPIRHAYVADSSTDPFPATYSTFQCHWAAALGSLDLDHEGCAAPAMEGPGNAYWQRGWWRDQSSCLLRNAASQPDLRGKNFRGQHLLVSMEDAFGIKVFVCFETSDQCPRTQGGKCLADGRQRKLPVSIDGDQIF
jgi:hypothetical protein